MAKKYGTPSWNSPAKSGNAKPPESSSTISSGPITSAAQARSLLRQFPQVAGLGPAKPSWPREVSEDFLSLQVIKQNGGPANPRFPFKLSPKTLAWLADQRLAQQPVQPKVPSDSEL